MAKRRVLLVLLLPLLLLGCRAESPLRNGEPLLPNGQMRPLGSPVYETGGAPPSR